MPGWHPWRGAAGAFHDDPDFRVSLLSTATIGAWDRRRFRANVVLEGAGEDVLVGRRVRCGDAELRVISGIPRCVMVTRPQAGGIERDTGVLKTIHRERDGELAVGALVTRAGDRGHRRRRDRAGLTSVRTVPLRSGEDTIRLGQLLKLADLVESGAEVKDVLLSGAVRVNGEPEERRGRQLHRGDVVTVDGRDEVRIG